MDEEERKQKKELIITSLSEVMGNIGVACKMSGIGRKTFYLWKDKDNEFKEKAETIIAEQNEEMNDFAEGKLYEHIRKDNIAALIFYLKTRHPEYKMKLQLEGGLKIEKELTEEDKKLLKKALQHGGFRNNQAENIR